MRSPANRNWFACLLILSGASSLIYEVAWVRLLGLSMGSTSAAVSTVLSAFFFGLALGSYAAYKLPKKNPLVTYLVLEGVIGVCGLALLPALLNLDALMIPLAESGMRLDVKFLVTLSLLSVPTICMGATFPIVAGAMIADHRETGDRISQLYALNTVGGIIGTLAAGFALIPSFGIDGAVYFAVSLNALVVVLGVLFIVTMSKSGENRAATPEVFAASYPLEPNASHPASGTTNLLLILLGTGLIAIATQVGWTKYLAVFTGATIYGFSLILAVVLSGIAIGSWGAKRFLRRFTTSDNLLWWLLVLLCLSLVLARVLLTWVPDIATWYGRQELSAAYRVLVVCGVVGLCLLVPTTLFGALFPLTTAAYCRETVGTTKRVGVAYATNTLGGILGAVIAGFWAIPKFGTDTLLTATAVATVLLSIGLIRNAGVIKSAFSFSCICFAMGAAWYLPHINYESLILAVTAQRGEPNTPPRFLFLREGKAGVISLTTSNNRLASLRNNGLPESYVNLEGFEHSPGIEVLLGIFPYLIHENPRSSFLIGLGGAHTLNTQALTDLTTIHVVELEPAILDAISMPNGPPAVLENPIVRLTFNDARNTLMLEPQRYDLISSQPSHPWVAGAGSLFTKEFFALVSTRLEPGGIFTQWVNLFQMDTKTLKSVMRAFYEAFPNGFAAKYPGSSDLLLLGSNRPIVFDLELFESRIAQPGLREKLASLRIYQPLDVLGLYALSRNEALSAAGEVTANSDLNLLSETQLARVGNQKLADPQIDDLFARYGKLDLQSHFPANARAQVLSDLANHYLDSGAVQQSTKLLQQLRKLDDERAQQLERQIRLRL